MTIRDDEDWIDQMSKLISDYNPRHVASLMLDAIRKEKDKCVMLAVKEEREACAKIADDVSDYGASLKADYLKNVSECVNYAAQTIATRIRARDNAP